MNETAAAIIKECSVPILQIDHIAVGQKMRNLRLAKKISGIELARKMGISTPYLCDMELGRRKWNTERVSKFMEALKSYCKGRLRRKIKKL